MLIPNKNNIKTITDMRENALLLLNKVAKENQPTIIFHRNSPKAVMLSIKRYNQLMNMLEDYFDGKVARELEKKPRKKSNYISFKSIAKKYGVRV